MAGQKYEFEVIAKLNATQLRSELRAVEQDFNRLQSRAATPNTGPVTGGTSNSLDTRYALLQAKVNALEQSIRASGNKLPAAQVQRVQQLANGGVIAQGTEALGTRPSNVNVARFNAEATRLLRASTQTSNLAEQTTRSSEQTAKSAASSAASTKRKADVDARRLKVAEQQLAAEQEMVTLYHATTSKVVKPILKEGIEARQSASNAVYGFTSEVDARRYAGQLDKQGNVVGNRSSSVIKYQVPRSELLPAIGEGEKAGTYARSNSVPPEAILAYTKSTGEFVSVVRQATVSTAQTIGAQDLLKIETDRLAAERALSASTERQRPTVAGGSGTPGSVPRSIEPRFPGVAREQYNYPSINNNPSDPLNRTLLNQQRVDATHQVASLVDRAGGPRLGPPIPPELLLAQRNVTAALEGRAAEIEVQTVKELGLGQQYLLAEEAASKTFHEAYVSRPPGQLLDPVKGEEYRKARLRQDTVEDRIAGPDLTARIRKAEEDFNKLQGNPGITEEEASQHYKRVKALWDEREAIARALVEEEKGALRAARPPGTHGVVPVTPPPVQATDLGVRPPGLHTEGITARPINRYANLEAANNLDPLNELLSTQKSLVAAYRTALRQYEVGVGTYDQLLTAEQTLVAAITKEENAATRLAAADQAAAAERDAIPRVLGPPTPPAAGFIGPPLPVIAEESKVVQDLGGQIPRRKVPVEGISDPSGIPFRSEFLASAERKLAAAMALEEQAHLEEVEALRQYKNQQSRFYRTRNKFGEDSGATYNAEAGVEELKQVLNKTKELHELRGQQVLAAREELALERRGALARPDRRGEGLGQPFVQTPREFFDSPSLRAASAAELIDVKKRLRDLGHTKALLHDLEDEANPRAGYIRDSVDRIGGRNAIDQALRAGAEFDRERAAPREDFRVNPTGSSQISRAQDLARDLDNLDALLRERTARLAGPPAPHEAFSLSPLEPFAGPPIPPYLIQARNEATAHPQDTLAAFGAESKGRDTLFAANKAQAEARVAAADALKVATGEEGVQHVRVRNALGQLAKAADVAAADIASGNYRDASGRLRNAQGRFVKATEDAAAAAGGGKRPPPPPAPPPPPRGGSGAGGGEEPPDDLPRQLAILQEEKNRAAAAIAAQNAKSQAQAADQEGIKKAESSYQAAQVELATLQQKRALNAARAARGEATETDLIAKSQVLRNEINAELKAQANAVARATYNQTQALPGAKRPDLLQRVQAGIASRGGEFKDPNDYLNTAQFLKSKFLTTAGFAVSGVATYAAFSGIQKMVSDSAKLEQILAQIRTQFSALGDSSAFAGFRQGILDISRGSGEAAGDVAKIAFQFKGAFQGKLDNSQILDQVKAAVQISRVTGLSLAEVTDSLTATALDYGTTIQHIGDVTLALQDRTGVLATHIITAVADLAPVADEVGLSLEKIASIAAVAQQRSGQSGSALAESLNRALPTIQDNAAPLIAFYQQARPLKADEILGDLASGQTGKVFDQIGKDFGSLTASQQKYVLSLLGTKKDLKGLIPVFANYQDVIDGSNAALDSSGRLSQGYAALQQTLSQQLSRVLAAFKNIGEAILSLGLSDALQVLAKGLGLVASSASSILGVFTALNDITGGWTGKLIAATLGIIALSKGLKAINALGYASAGRNALNAIPGVSVGGGAGKAVENAAVQSAGLGVPFIAGGGAAIEQSGKKYTERFKAHIGNIKTSMNDAEGVIGKSSAGLTTAFAGLSTAISTLGPLVAIAALIAAIDIFTTEFQKHKARLEGEVAQYGTDAGKATDAQLIGGTPQLDKDLAAYQKSREPASFNDAFSHIGSVPIAINPVGAIKGAAKDIVNFGSKTPSQVQEDQVQKRITKDFATSITKTLSKDELKGLVDDYNATVPKDEGKRLDVDDIKDIAKRGSTSDKKFNAMIQLLTIEAKKHHGRGKAIAETITALQKGRNDRNQTLIDVAAELEALPTLQSQVELGQITPEQFATKAKRGRDDAIKALNQAVAEGITDPKVLASLQKGVSDYSAAFDKELGAYLTNLVSTKTQLETLRGGSQQSITATTISAGLLALKQPNAYLTTAGPQIAQQIVAAQQTQLQYMYDHASSVAAQNRILRTPQKIDPSVLKQLNVGNLAAQVPVVAPQFAGVTADILKNNVPGAESLVDLYHTLLNDPKGIKDALTKLYKRWITVLQRMVKEHKPGAIGKLKEAEAELGRVNAVSKLLQGLLASDTVSLAQQNAPTLAEQTAASDALAVAQAGPDPLAQAAVRGDLARKHLQDIKSVPAPVRGKGQSQKSYNADLKAYEARQRTDSNTATAAVLDANQQYEDVIAANSASKFAILSALADGDPLKTAQAAIGAADDQLAHAHGIAAQNQAIAAQISAQHQLRDAIFSIFDSLFSLTQAIDIAAGRAGKAAQDGLNQAKAVLSRDLARGAGLGTIAADKQRIVEQQAAVRDFIFGVFDAQASLIQAIDVAAGRTVKAARDGLKQAQAVFTRDKKRGADASVLIPDRQRIVEAKANLRDTILQNETDEINFELHIKKITEGQAIQRLKILNLNRKLTKAEHQQLLTQIYDLQHQNEQDLQFNLPSDIRLPTLYEARRFNQSGGGQNYQDNRRIDIRISTNAKLDPQEIADHVTQAISAPPRYGTRRGVY